MFKVEKKNSTHVTFKEIHDGDFFLWVNILHFKMPFGKHNAINMEKVGAEDFYALYNCAMNFDDDAEVVPVEVVIKVL